MEIGIKCFSFLTYLYKYLSKIKQSLINPFLTFHTLKSSSLIAFFFLQIVHNTGKETIKNTNHVSHLSSSYPPLLASSSSPLASSGTPPSSSSLCLPPRPASSPGPSPAPLLALARFPAVLSWVCNNKLFFIALSLSFPVSAFGSFFLFAESVPVDLQINNLDFVEAFIFYKFKVFDTFWQFVDHVCTLHLNVSIITVEMNKLNVK